jgi:predicted TIM-barrel fold metal-dependent hydrolase
VADDNPVVVATVGNIRVAHPDFKDSLERFSRHPLYRGIRINAAALPGLLAQGTPPADLELLARKDLSLDILLDGPSRFGEVARLASLLPELRIVVGHLPLERSASGLRTLARMPRVYAKVSGVARSVNGRVPTDAAFYKAALDELWDVFGPDRVIYASNWPVCDLIAPYPVVYGIVRDYLAAKGQEATEKYFWKNAAAFYKCRERPQG